MILLIHTLAGIVALIAGAINLLRTKGTPHHRQVGWLYAAAMYLLIGTSFLSTRSLAALARFISWLSSAEVR